MYMYYTCIYIGWDRPLTTETKQRRVLQLHVSDPMHRGKPIRQAVACQGPGHASAQSM